MKTSIYTKKGFTLIELLVVVVIILILAAILFPVFAKARDRARLAVCVSNARQIATALRQYLNDYDDTFPCMNTPAARVIGDGAGFLYFGRYDWTPWDAASLNYVKNYSYIAQLEPYLKNDEVRVCPSDHQVTSVPTLGVRYTSYSYRRFVAWTMCPNMFDIPAWRIEPFACSVFKSKYFKDPSKTYIIHESFWKRNLPTGGYTLYDFHTRNDVYRNPHAAFTMVFADCHAKYMEIGPLWWPAGAVIYEPDYWNMSLDSRTTIPGFRDML